jgi:hypothetical protein
MKFQELMEQYGMLTKQQRLFYPRNFTLSTEFTRALKKELEIQAAAGIDLDIFAKKLNKALQFYIADYKKLKSAKKAEKVPNASALANKKPLT